MPREVELAANAEAVFDLPQDGTLRFLLLGLGNNEARVCPSCRCKIRDRRPGPVKQNEGVCVDRVYPDGRRENWVALICKGCAVKRYGFPVKRLEDIYWPGMWVEDTNAA